jgi:hypothetical protein
MTTPNAFTLKTRTVRNGALDKTAREISARRRAEGLRVLAAIHAAVPRADDLEGRACGIVAVLTVAERAHVSGKAVARALRHWQSWRVFWLWWKGSRNWEVRFERRVVEELLSTPRYAIGAFLVAHKLRCEVRSERNSGQQIAV